MKPEIVFIDNITEENGQKFTKLSIDELKNLIDKAYNAGYADGQREQSPIVVNPLTTPYTPTWSEKWTCTSVSH